VTMAMNATLADRLASRQNAVTLLRLGFAVLVVFGHAWEVGGRGPDPLMRAAGVSCGEMGVNAFFALSGFLVTQSWLRSRSPWDYIRRRALRIFPGFWTCLGLTGLGLFPWLWARQRGTTWLDAFSQAPFLGYIARNALLRIRQPGIGDLFSAQPATGIVNGPLWSLFPEFLCYLGVMAVGLLGGFALKRRLLPWLAAGATFAVHLAGPAVLAHLSGPAFDFGWYLWRVATQAAFFSSGALCCLQAGRIQLTGARTLLPLGLLALALWGGGYAWFGPILLPLSILQLAAVLPGAGLDHVGDYSYGIYVYHFPVQQALISLGVAAVGAWGFFGQACALVLPVAMLSWHLVEKPALRLKGRPTARTAAPTPSSP